MKSRGSVGNEQRKRQRALVGEVSAFERSFCKLIVRGFGCDVRGLPDEPAPEEI
jgi:hypothetical protein